MFFFVTHQQSGLKPEHMSAILTRFLGVDPLVPQLSHHLLTSVHQGH